MRASEIHSRGNTVVKTVRLVGMQSRRAPEGLVLAEGLRVLEEATASGFEIRLVVLGTDFGRVGRESRLLDEWKRRRTLLYRAAEPILKSLSDVLSPQGALALVHVPERQLPAELPPHLPLLLFACGIQDPGNLGTLLRTARAADATLLCTTPGTVSARNPKAVRASAGAFFFMPVVECVSAEALRSYCLEQDIRVYRTSARTGTPCWSVDWTVPCALVLGNESKGVEERPWREFPQVRIPMLRGAESLNVAAAAAVLLFEALRQRAPGLPRLSC